MPVLTFYSRPGCHLCDDALAVVHRARARAAFELVEIDIEGDDEIFKRYLERIPVVAIDGVEHAELFVDEEALVSALSSPTTMTPDVMTQPERLSLGVAARLARYLQVLTQAKKEGKETISSQELSEWTHVNSTQIRRDLSGFGKFGKRGVGYNVDSLVSQIRKILRTAGQHNIALFGAGHLGRAIASSHIFADHGFRVVAIFDNDPAKVGEQVGNTSVRPLSELKQAVDEDDIVVGVLAVPGASAQMLADQLVGVGVKIIFNYSEALLQVPPEVTVHTSSPAVDLLYALYFYLT
jgi:redox-sensing transcriptional repressor